MSREILFRGKRVDDGEWVYGYYFKPYTNSFISNRIKNGYPEVIEVHIESVGQFTGLLDKTGKKIFEGDVVYLAGYGNYIVQFPFLDLYQASWENDIGSIIYNIHDNPELI